MKPNRTNPLVARLFRGNTLVSAVVVSLAGLALPPSAQAGDLYWDTNADVAGSGNAGGAWNSGTNWTTDSTGALATVGWTDGEQAIFAAGTDGVGAYAVTVSGTVATPSILVEEAGAKTITGGTITIGGGAIHTAAAGNGNGFTISSILAGSGGLTISANGDTSDTGGGVGGNLFLSGANTISGEITLRSGVTVSNSNFGGSGNKIIFDGGGIVDTGNNTLFANNLEIPAGKVGIYRTYGGVTTARLTGTITGAGNLRRTDGGTLYIAGDGSGFTGTLTNARGNLYLVSQNWAGTDLVSTDGGNTIYFPTAGDTTIKSLTSDRDLNIVGGARLNIATGIYNAVSPPTINNFWMQGAGKITSASNTLTFNWDTSYDTAGDQSVRVIVEDYAPGVPLAVVKNGPGGLNNFDKANTYSGGTTINGGRIAASNVLSFGPGAVTVNTGGQAFLTAAGTYANLFTLNGSGCTEAAGVLGAIRFGSNTVAGTIHVASDARVGAYGGYGNHTGALTGSANLEINSNHAGFNGTINFSGNTAGYTGTMTLTQGGLTVGASGLGGGLVVNGGTATALNAAVTRAGGTATLSGGVAGNLTVNGGMASADGATAVATAGGGTVTANGPITGNVAVNAGSLTLTNGGTGTAVAGTAVLNSSVAGNVTVADGATLGGEGSVAGTLTLGGSAGATLRVKGLTTGALAVGTLKMDPASLNTVVLESLPSVSGPFVVLDYTTLGTGDESNFSVPLNVFRGNPQVQHDVDNTRFTLELDSQVRTWSAGESTDWGTAAANWEEGDNLFFSGDSVIFANNGVGPVNLVGTVAPMSITFSNGAGNSFVLAGAGGIAGSTGINKMGLGDVSLGGANTFTGPITVNTGVLTLGSAGSLGQAVGVTVAAGMRVNLGGQAVGNTTNTTWTISGDGGDGVGGLGAVVNTGGDIYEDSSIKYLVLAADAEIGSNNGRFDIGRDGSTGTGGTINGGGFTLHKVGTNAMVFRGPATNISYVLDAGALTFEDYDAASGINPITVNAGTLGSYNPRTMVNEVTFTAAGATLVSQAGNGTWTGVITLNGNTTFQAAGNLIIDGSLAGTGNIAKTGAGALVLQNSASGYSGKISSNAGTLRIETNAALGSYAGPDAITLGGGTLQGGTITALASTTIGSATQGITHTAATNYDAGTGNTLTIGGLIAGTGNIVKTNNTGALVLDRGATITGLVNANGGSLVINQALSLTGPLQTGGTIVTTFSGTGGSIGSDEGSGGGLHLWRSTLNIAHTGTLTVWDVETQEGTGEKADINQSSGVLNVTKDLRIGHWGNATAADFCTYTLSGGTINQPDTVTGPTDEGQANLFLGIDGTGVLNQTGGTINTTSMVIDGRGDTPGTDTYRMTGGRLNMGKWGIRSGNTGITKLIELGGGTVGATADWTSGMAMTLTGTNGNVVIDTLDPVASVPRSITLSGVLSGTGGLTKTGAGILSLTNAAGTFTGTAAVNGGTLLVNSGAAASGTLKTVAGGTLRPGTLTGTGVANLGNLTLDGGSADFRIGTSTDKFVVTGTLTVNSPTSIRAIPGTAISGTFPQYFDVIDYTGAIAGPVGFDNLNYASSNPHLKGKLNNDTTNTMVQVMIESADFVIWKGNASANWDVDVDNKPWVLGSDGTTPSSYYDFDVVRFDDGGLGASTVNLVGTITPATLSVENTTGNYTFQGSPISGGTGLVKTGGGTLTVLTNNSFTGPVDIQGGRVQIGNGGAGGVLGGSGNIPLATGTTLAFNTSTAAVLPATRLVTGGGAIEQNGTGTLEFQGIHSFSGGLTLNSGSVLLSAGGGDSGIIGGVVTVNGGTLSATVGNAFGWGASRIYTLNVNGGTVTTSANGDQGWGIAINLTAGTIGSTGAGYYSLGGGSAVNYQGTTTPATFSGAIRLREGNPADMLPFTVADGAAPIDLSVSGSISLGGGLSKSGPGTMELSGANSFTGPLGINEGTLRYTRPRHTVIPNALTGTGGTLEHNSPQELVLSGDGTSFGGTIDANGKVVRLAAATSGSGTGGTLALEGGSLNLGLNTEGLLFYGTFAGAAMVTTPLTTTVLSETAAGLHGGIGGNTTIAYDGEIYLTAGEWSFGENVDDAVYVTVGGATIINDGTWDFASSGTFSAPSDGWYPITLRVQNGGGGNGPVGAWATAGIGIGIKKGAASTVVADYTRFEIGALGTKCRAVMAAGAHTMVGGLSLAGGAVNTVDTGDGTLALNGLVTGGAANSLVKNGTGTLSLNGANPYTGETVVNAGTLALNGTSLIDTNKLVIYGGKVDVVGTEIIGSLVYGSSAQAPGTYGSTLSGAANQDDTRFSGTGMVLVQAAGFSSWIGGFGLALGDQDATDDPDNDGLDNAVEWVLGGNPAAAMDAGKLPTVAVTGGNLVFTFKRDQDSKVAGTSVAIQVGINLADWPSSFLVGSDTAGSTPGVTVTDNGDGTDTVVLTVAQAPDAQKYARLSVTIH